MKNRDKILEKHLKATINLGKAKTLSLKSDRIYSDGACGQTRTPDLLITNQLLYQLSYTGKISDMSFVILGYIP